MIHYSMQGSSAFVCGWVLFADRVSNGVLNKLVLQLKPQKLVIIITVSIKHIYVHIYYAATYVTAVCTCM